MVDWEERYMIAIARPIANVTITPVPVPRFMDLLNHTFGGYNQSVTAAPNWTGTISDVLLVYPDFFGATALLIVAMLPFVMMWISQGNMKMAGVTGLLTCALIFPFIPATYQAVAIILICMNVVILAWGLYKP
jgi:hypothetical protein